MREFATLVFFGVACAFVSSCITYSVMPEQTKFINYPVFIEKPRPIVIPEWSPNRSYV